MKNIYLSVILVRITFAYNLDVENPIIYNSNSNARGTDQPDNSFFGYNVILHARSHISINGTTVRESWIIVGAPKANYSKHPDHSNKVPEEPGVAYRCPLKGSCVPITVANPDDEVGFIDEVQLNTFIEKGHGWFGAAMSSHDASGLLTICAPRTIARIYNTFAVLSKNTMHGVCYNGQLTSGSLQIEDRNFSTFQFSSTFWYNPMNGFSVHYPLYQAKWQPEKIRPVVGSPKRELYGTVQEMGQKKPTELPVGDDLAQFGYSLTSGYFFFEDQLMVAGGAPGWQYVGQVAIMDPRTEPLSIVVMIEGNEIGEFFGASLASGDLNKDGLDDLIVGSPHWKNDNGRVQIFFGNKGGFFEADIVLEGGVADALYGYAVTSGDLDGDGFDEIIVGAPWEESGVIYVYNGDAKLQEFNMMKASQRIVASEINKDLRRFGFSLAKPIDMDGNGFSDLGVGAYASGHAVVLLSRPVLKTEITLATFPTILPRNSTNFILEVCVRNFIKNKPSMWAFECLATADEDYKRVVYKSSNTMILTWKKPPEDRACDNTTFTIAKNSRNFIDVIDIVVTHRILNSSHESQGHREKCQLCPIEYKGSHSTVARTKLPFDIGCGMDDVCQAFIFAKLFFRDISNSTWIIGSEHLSLVLIIGNHAEPAYLTTVKFFIPTGITLRSILPSCQEEENDETLMVTCDVGNPLGTAMEKRVTLDLDMNRMHNGSRDGTKLDFRADIKTRSANSGVVSVAIPLYLKANISVAVSGKAYDKNYYFNYKSEKPSNVTFHHTYQISRFGETPIFEARIAVKVPYRVEDLEFLKIVNKPRVSVLGRFYECSVSNVTVEATRISLDKTIMMKNQFDEMVHLNTFGNNTRVRREILEDKNLSIKGADAISRGNIDAIDSDKIDHKAQSDFYKMSKLSDADVVYLNCSTPKVKCGQVTCNVAHLEMTQDIGKLQLQFVMENSKLIDETEENEKVIHFATEVWLEVVNPTTNFIISGTRNIVPVTTTFHRAQNSKNVSIWIILGSILLGLLALSIIAIILKRLGFFNRSQKQELNTLKSNEAIPLDFEQFLYDD